ncbi:hypothetical protein PCH70_29400 [Pseudomonas cichorii JBC1]|nr:hypothetical protein PCH70_29400 [Pseudomonas cichorii JBC1]
MIRVFALLFIARKTAVLLAKSHFYVFFAFNDEFFRRSFVISNEFRSQNPMSRI